MKDELCVTFLVAKNDVHAFFFQVIVPPCGCSCFYRKLWDLKMINIHTDDGLLYA